MKYIGLVLVVGLLAFAVWFSQKTEDLSIEQMDKINVLITQYMTQAVEANQPKAEEIEVSKIYTEVVERGRKMKSHFKLSYMEPNEKGEMEKVHRKGVFLITSKDGQQWQAQIETAGDVKVEFMEPITINGE